MKRKRKVPIIIKLSLLVFIITFFIIFCGYIFSNSIGDISFIDKIFTNFKNTSAEAVKDISELIKWTYSEPFPKEKIAAVAETVCKTAKMGNRISIKILEAEANEAVISVEAVANKLNLRNKEFDLVLVGSVFKCEKYFKAILIKKLKEKFEKIDFKPLTKKPVRGAIRLTIENL
ncbi:unnamed protein product [marine sediment metagenome]|uniref:ATPase BadF/BadG/BcrA/BcrD type domain-containing protein n=1 Tax=marine sediment metagenome TaxID=412755 RepID=X0ZUU3_9ZZZZ